MIWVSLLRKTERERERKFYSLGFEDGRNVHESDFWSAGHCSLLPGLPALPLFLFTLFSAQQPGRYSKTSDHITPPSCPHFTQGQNSCSIRRTPCHWLSPASYLSDFTSFQSLLRDYVDHASTFFIVLLWSNTLTLFFCLNRHIWCLAANYKTVTFPPV